MKILFDFLPLLIFFAVYKGAPYLHPPSAGSEIFYATGALMAAVVLQIIWLKSRRREVGFALWLGCGLVLVFGALTLGLRDKIFIQLKPTILYWGFAGALLAAVYIFRRNPAGALLGKVLELPDALWRRMNGAFAGFFAAMGALNLLLVYGLSEAAWIKIRSFGYPLLTFIFIVTQLLAVRRYAVYKERP
jgi:intracellular septation protein